MQTKLVCSFVRSELDRWFVPIVLVSGGGKDWHWLQSRMNDLIDVGKTDEALDLVRELGKDALAEHGDWVMLHRERPIELPKAEI